MAGRIGWQSGQKSKGGREDNDGIGDVWDLGVRFERALASQMLVFGESQRSWVRSRGYTHFWQTLADSIVPKGQPTSLIDMSKNRQSQTHSRKDPTDRCRTGPRPPSRILSCVRHLGRELDIVLPCWFLSPGRAIVDLSSRMSRPLDHLV
jgi:hypothetical protein